MWPPVLGAPIITSLNKGNSSFSAAIAFKVKSKPFKGTSALAVVIIWSLILEILSLGEKTLKSIPFGITDIFLLETLKSLTISFFELIDGVEIAFNWGATFFAF